MTIRRRDLLGALGLGAGAAMLTPVLTRLVAEARGEEAAASRLNLVVFTDGNGWTHQGGGSRNSPTLDTTVRSVTDWDMPAVLQAFEPYKDKVTICRPFQNRYGKNLHGNGWGTLTVAKTSDNKPGGVSLDRFVALATGREDPFPSIALGVATRSGRPAVCTSADGALRPFPAVASPNIAHANLFGGGNAADAQAALAQDRSLLDAMIADIHRARGSLASAERAKLEQLLTSYRTMERQLVARQEIFANRPPPTGPGEAANGSLNDATVKGHVDVIANALGFGLTHVAHLSVMGFDAHNVGWGFLGFPGDAHEAVAHTSNGYNRERSNDCYATTIDYKATQLARLYAALDEIEQGDSTMAKNSLFVWINSGGGKHHDGSAWHPVVMLGDAGGKIKGGQYITTMGKPSIADAFLTISHVMGVESETFGDSPDEASLLTSWLT